MFPSDDREAVTSNAKAIPETTAAERRRRINSKSASTAMDAMAFDGTEKKPIDFDSR